MNEMKPAPRSILCLALCAAAAVAADTADAVSLLSRGMEHLGSGDSRGARPLLRQAYDADSSDPRIQLAFAAAAPSGDIAERLLRRVVSDTGASASQRAHALSSLAGMHYVREEYAEAAARYTEAFALSARSEDAVRAGLAELQNGRMKQARELFAKAAESGADGSAVYYQSLLAFSRRDYAQALAGFKNAIDSAPRGAWWQGPSTAGCALSAERLGYLNLAVRYRREHEQQFDNSLEQALFGRGFSPLPGAKDEHFGTVSEKKPKPKAKPQPTPKAAPGASSSKPATPDTDTESYTVQVGSFGSRENAEKLQRSMAADFDNVRIVPAEVEGKTYYRVRVGRFDDPETAEAFAQRHIARKGISHKVLVNR